MTTTTAHPVDTQLIGIIHDALRRDLGRTFDTLATRTPPGAYRRAALADHIVWTLRFLWRHHANEDQGLWPLVRQRNPSAAPLLDELTSGHARIALAVRAVERAADSYRHSGAVSVRDDLRGALERLCTLLLPQLDREADEVMPLVCASVTSAEWDDWLHRYLIETTSTAERARELHWLIDALEPERRVYTTRTITTNQRFVSRFACALTCRRRTRLLRA